MNITPFEHCTIELDCEPGAPRPDTYIGRVLEGTGLTVEDFHITSKCFGNWTWQLNEETNCKAFTEAKSLFKGKIEELYDEGKIRYGSW